MRRLLALAASLTLASAALAQRPGQPIQQSDRPVGPVISLKFPGGTVAEYVAALRAASAVAEPVNITCSTEALSLRVPEVSLRDVTLDSALRAAAFAAQENGEQRLVVEAIGSLNRTDAFAIAAMPIRSSVVSRELQVFSIRDLTEPKIVQVETILTAVEAALALVESGSPATTKYHKESGLLMIRGNMQQLNAAEQVLKRLESSAKGADARARAARVAKAEARARLDRADAVAELCRHRVQDALAARDEAAKLQQGGATSAREVREAEFALASATTELTAAEAEVAAARVAAENDMAPSGQGDDALAKENAQLRDELAALRKHIEQLMNAVDGKAKPPASPAGRPGGAPPR